MTHDTYLEIEFCQKKSEFGFKYQEGNSFCEDCCINSKLAYQRGFKAELYANKLRIKTKVIYE